MPVPNPETFLKMLNFAKEKKFAYPSINVTSTETANAALTAFAKAKSDGIIQISTGGAKFASGPAGRYGARRNFSCRACPPSC